MECVSFHARPSCINAAPTALLDSRARDGKKQGLGSVGGRTSASAEIRLERTTRRSSLQKCDRCFLGVECRAVACRRAVLRLKHSAWRQAPALHQLVSVCSFVERAWPNVSPRCRFAPTRLRIPNNRRKNARGGGILAHFPLQRGHNLISEFVGGERLWNDVISNCLAERRYQA